MKNKLRNGIIIFIIIVLIIAISYCLLTIIKNYNDTRDMQQNNIDAAKEQTKDWKDLQNKSSNFLH